MYYAVQMKVNGIWRTVNTAPDVDKAADIATAAYRCSPDKEVQIVERKENTD